jgi:hypothetical protein
MTSDDPDNGARPSESESATEATWPAHNTARADLANPSPRPFPSVKSPSSLVCRWRWSLVPDRIPFRCDKMYAGPDSVRSAGVVLSGLPFGPVSSGRAQAPNWTRWTGASSLPSCFPNPRTSIYKATCNCVRMHRYLLYLRARIRLDSQFYPTRPYIHYIIHRGRGVLSLLCHKWLWNMNGP